MEANLHRRRDVLADAVHRCDWELHSAAGKHDDGERRPISVQQRVCHGTPDGQRRRRRAGSPGEALRACRHELSATVTVDGEPFVLEGGTQTFDYETSGWGWIWGGGAEIWATSPLAIYAELKFVGIKGDDRRGGEFTVDDTMRAFVAGVRYRLGRFGR